jgi:hypothetical protein
MADPTRQRLLVGNCSAFYGDRVAAAAEMLRGGPIDVLTGDYLAELTMGILYRARARDPRGGYAVTFLKQLEAVLGECLDRKIRIVASAGGLNPRALAEDVGALATRLGLHPRIAFIEGDDLMPRLAELDAAGEPLAHLDRGTRLRDVAGKVVTANAYLGARAIKEALRQGADVVVCPRVSDASLVVGPSAWAFEWADDDWDRLAAGVVAGHVLECGTQATGGNYSFFEEVASFSRMGFPIAEMFPDGSFVVTKHPGTGGLVSVGTVTAQLLYEIDGPRYLSPDAVARFDSMTLEQEGPDRVRVRGVRGEPPPARSKVSINYVAGYRNTATFLITGLDIERKAQVVEHSLDEALGGRDRFALWDVRLMRTDRLEPTASDEAHARLQVTVLSPDEARVGKAFTAGTVELVTANIPGLTLSAPPRDPSLCVLHWPALVGREHVLERLFVDGQEVPLPPPPTVTSGGGQPEESPTAPLPTQETTARVPLGRLFGARSGDKGGNASLGVWARDEAAWAFLREYLTVGRLVLLLPDAARCRITRHELPNLRALSFVLAGYLGEGPALPLRADPQAKTLAELLRARIIDVPATLAASGTG